MTIRCARPESVIFDFADSESGGGSVHGRSVGNDPREEFKDSGAVGILDDLGQLPIVLGDCRTSEPRPRPCPFVSPSHESNRKAPLKNSPDPQCRVDFSRPWYHGSQQPLTQLRSSISEQGSGEAFSHRPSLVSMSERGDAEVSPETFSVRHDGQLLAFSCRPRKLAWTMCIRIPIRPMSPWEWVTDRELKLELVERT